jgi:hypothetical protein
MVYSLALRRCVHAALVVASFAWLGAVNAEDISNAAIKVTLPKDIKWVENTAAGSATAVMLGDPAKPGLYIVLTKWHANHNSRPHFHPNDRYITVLSGTWWVGTGAKYDLASTKPLPPGTFVKHVGKEIHYDGAKDGDVVLQILGEGPATSTPAEAK